MVGAAFLSFSCTKDEENVDPYDINYVYVYEPARSSHELQYLEDGTFQKIINESDTLVPVKCTKPAPGDITVRIAIDTSLVSAFNEAHGTRYVGLKNAKLANTTLSIKKDEYVSENIVVSYTDFSEFKNGKEHYMVPVTITAVDGKGVKLSETRTFYLTFESYLIYCGVTDAPSGTQIEDRSNWKYYINGTESTSFSGYVDQNEYILDLGEEVSISNIQLTFYEWYFASRQAHIYISKDGVDFNDYGTVDLMMTKTSNIELYAHPSARYIKFTCNDAFYYDPYLIGINIFKAS